MANHTFGKKQLDFRLRRNGDANLKKPVSDCLPLQIYFDPGPFSLIMLINIKQSRLSPRLVG